MFSEIFQYTNASPIIMTMIFLISFYMGLHQANILPPIYTGKVPVRYEKLLENSLKGEKEIIVGFPKHELYWGEFQNFLSQMKMRKGKIRER